MAGVNGEDKHVLSMDEILAADDVEYAEIEGWKGMIRIGSLSAEDFIEFNDTNEGPAKKTANVRIILKSLVDKDGKRIGSDKHIEALKKKSHATINRIVQEIIKLNGLEVPKDAKNV